MVVFFGNLLKYRVLWLMVLGKVVIKFKFFYYWKFKFNICVFDGKKKEIGYLLEFWLKCYWILVEKWVLGFVINFFKLSWLVVLVFIKSIVKFFRGNSFKLVDYISFFLVMMGVILVINCMIGEIW